MSAPKGHEALWACTPIVLAQCNGRVHSTMHINAKVIVCGAGKRVVTNGNGTARVEAGLNSSHRWEERRSLTLEHTKHDET